MKNILNSPKKGQLTIGDAPGVVLIVLFLFMVMGTSAFVLEKYQEGFGADKGARVNNESITNSSYIAGTAMLTGRSACNSENFIAVHLLNASGNSDQLIHAGNYSLSSTGLLTNNSAEFTLETLKLTYSYKYSGIACNVTTELAGEIEDNSSIAGMILTIALIGIVLSILIGLFYVFTGRRGGM